MRRGLMLLDVIIIILAIGVVATLLLPKIRTDKEVRLREACRQRMMLISEAEMKYFETAGGRLAPDTTDTTKQETKKKSKKSKKQEIILRKFTDDPEILKKFLPEGADTFDFVCPLDGRAYIIVARDSFFYSISCPNGHGQVILGNPSWETK